MSNKVYSAFKEYDFFGEFFSEEESYEVRFPAKIHYSPNTGLKIDYLIYDSDFKSKNARLFGVLNNGQKCTLIGPFDFDSGTHQIDRIGKTCTKSGEHPFSHLIIGDFIKEDKKFDHCRFTFNHMQEFFYSQGHLSKLKYSDEIIETIKGENWLIEIVNKATCNMVGDNLINLIHSTDDSALEDLSVAMKKINENNPKASFSLRKSLEFLFKFGRNEPKKVEEFTLDAYRISSLFSLFMNKPTFPDELKIFPSSDAKDSVHVISSMLLESGTVELAKKEPHHLLLPINRNEIDLSEVITAWFEGYDDFKVISTTFQYETGFRTLHSAYSDIVLFATNIEAINQDLPEKSNKKYEKPIKHYGSEKLRNMLNAIFSTYNCYALNKNISDLRNELAHIGKPKKLMKAMTIDDYVDIGQLLKLIVVSHLFKKIGIQQNLIHKYQNKLLPR